MAKMHSTQAKAEYYYREHCARYARRRERISKRANAMSYASWSGYTRWLTHAAAILADSAAIDAEQDAAREADEYRVDVQQMSYPV